MSCKSAIYAANTAAQTTISGSTISFGSVVRRYGRCLNLSGGNVVADESGYYDINTNFTFTASAAGNVTISLYEDGVLIPGAVQTATVTSASIYNLNVPAIVRKTCCCESSITAIITGVAGVINNAAIKVERI